MKDAFQAIYDTAVELANGDERYLCRLRHEYEQIRDQGVEQYWVDLVKSGKKHKTNKNGLVLPFLLNITTVDPIKEQIEPNIKQDYDMPDIDIDFLPEARPHIKKWIIDTYGADNTCNVGLWQTYNPKSALEDVARAYGYDNKKRELIEISKTLPLDFDDVDLEDACSDRYPQFKEWVEADPINKTIAETAFRLVGRIKAQGTHAGGVIISSVPLAEHLPTTKIGESSDIMWTSEWTEGLRSTQLSKFGFVKYDVLGLKTLSYIWAASKMVKQTRGIDIVWKDIPLDDELALKMANDVKVDSVFQLDTDIARGILKSGGVKTFKDLIVYISLGRPGPLPMVKEYIDRRDGKKSWEKEEHPKMAALLDDTYGICVYQEQVTSILTNLAGFSIPEAEKARKIMSKKWSEQLEWVKQRAIAGFNKTMPGYGPTTGEDGSRMTWAQMYWQRLSTFARYSFNKSHALSYTIQSYRCLYLKSHYPAEWWCAVLNNCDLDKLPRNVAGVRNNGIELINIDCNRLYKNFAVVDGKIILGLVGIKGIGEKAISRLVCGENNYKSFDEFVKANGHNKTLYERLIKLGAFDGIYQNRRKLWYWYLYKYGTASERKQVRSSINEKYSQIKNVKVKNSFSLSFDEFDKHIDIDDYSPDQLLGFQQQYLGFFWDSPMSIYKHNTDHNIRAAKRHGYGRIDCVITNVEHRKTKNNKSFITLTVVDNKDQAKLNLWENDLSSVDNADEMFKPGVGLGVRVKWSEVYNSFSLVRGGTITMLKKKKREEANINNDIINEMIEKIEEEL